MKIGGFKMDNLFSKLSCNDFDTRCKAYKKLSDYDTARATDLQAEAIYFYTTCHDINLLIKETIASHQDLNEKILNNKNFPGKFIPQIDKFLQSGKRTTHNLKLYKGVIHKDLDRLFAHFDKSISFKNFREFIGITYLEPAYMSTTISKPYAMQAINNNRKFYHEEKSTKPDALFCIDIPIGTRICATDNMAKRMSKQINHQYEILLPRNQKFIIHTISKICLNTTKYLIIDAKLQNT